MLEWVMRAADRVDGCVVPLRRNAAVIAGVYRGTVNARSLRSEFHTPSVSQRPIERARWCHSTTGLSERIVSGHWPQKSPVSGETGDFPSNVFVSIRQGWAAAFGGRNPGGGVPYGPNSIRRA